MVQLSLDLVVDRPRYLLDNHLDRATRPPASVSTALYVSCPPTRLPQPRLSSRPSSPRALRVSLPFLPVHPAPHFLVPPPPPRSRHRALSCLRAPARPPMTLRPHPWDGRRRRRRQRRRRPPAHILGAADGADADNDGEDASSPGTAARRGGGSRFTATRGTGVEGWGGTACRLRQYSGGGARGDRAAAQQRRRRRTPAHRLWWCVRRSRV